MKTLTIEAQPRTKLGTKEARKLVNASLIPCVLYGNHHKKNISICCYVNAIDVQPLTKEPYFVDLKIEGKSYPCIVQTKQRHPIGDHITHIDFLAIFKDKPVTMHIPLKLEGRSKGEEAGGMLRQNVRTLKIQALSKHMPSFVSLDISNMELSDSLKVRDIVTEHCRILTPAGQPAVTIGLTRALRSKQGASGGAGNAKK
ncbi:MAG: 50S ribosomal protein L25 [Cytophagales bacterium]